MKRLKIPRRTFAGQAVTADRAGVCQAQRELRAGLASLAAVLVLSGAVFAGDPVALWIEPFTVAPSSQPLAHVVIKNLTDASYEGTVALAVPEGWQIDPAARHVSLSPGQTERVGFDVRRGTSVEANRYAVTASATSSGVSVLRKQDVVTASAPYFKPTIDGDPSDWTDAIPVTFTTGGKETVIRTFWNSRQFSLLVAVGEERLVGFSEGAAAAGRGACDAVQVALSPKGAVTGTSPDGEAGRYELLVIASGGGRCFQLASPGTPLAQTQKPRPLAPLAYEEAEVAVRRSGETTYYEIGLPFRPMRERIRPGEGREFCLSLLVHDPDGTGLRDWGQAAGLWPSQRNALAWSRWQGDGRGENPPFDNKIPWGMCSSKY